MDRNRTRGPFKDLPDPPAQNSENYASALSKTLRALDTTWQVAPYEQDRQFIEDLQEEVREELLDVLKSIGREDDA